MFASSSDDKSQSSPDLRYEKRKHPELECRCADALVKISYDISNISDSVNNIKIELSTITQVTSEIKSELNSLRADHFNLEKKVCNLESKHLVVAEDVASLQNSLQYTMDQQAELANQMRAVCDQTNNTEALQNMISGMENKIDALEQQARHCNLEICNIPEKRNENLLNLMEDISSKIKFSLNQKDILSIHRVPHAHKQSANPKNIIVKLNSRILRDNMLSAFRLAKGLKSDQLGFTGNQNRVYMHEHLTLKRKQLFRQCKDAAIKNNFKYIWVKHATILVRESESAPSIAIRSFEDIAKIKPAKQPTNSNKH